MKVVILTQKEVWIDKYRDIVRKKLESIVNCEIEYLHIDAGKRNNIIKKLKEMLPDIFVTFDLQGFEQSTLTDNLSFNLLDCKQIHLILHNDLINEMYLTKQLSISMFFYCLGDECYHYLVERYPNLPYLKQISGWDTQEDQSAAINNTEILADILQEVKHECNLL